MPNLQSINVTKIIEKKNKFENNNYIQKNKNKE